MARSMILVIKKSCQRDASRGRNVVVVMCIPFELIPHSVR